MAGIRRGRVVVLSIIFMVTCIYYIRNQPVASSASYPAYIPGAKKPVANDGRIHWSKLPDAYPVPSYVPLPTGKPKKIPLVQAQQPKENAKERDERLKRKTAVAESFAHSWKGYKSYAWLRDEVAPISGNWKDTFGGWAATLVDSLDTLWIMGMKQEFEAAVRAAEDIDFTTTEESQVNVFETTIRYMGGFLAAYDISGGKYPVLLAKAVEVGELLMSCFDTPNRMPITRWDWKEYGEGSPQRARITLVSELGSLSVEFTRLSQLTGDPKYYDAIQRIADEFEKSQNSTKLPGMWPITIDASVPSFDGGDSFTLGGMSDSLYEYLPKQYLILGGLLEQPRTLYENFIEVAKKHLFFRIYNPKDEPLSVSGDIRMSGVSPDLMEPHLNPQGQHLTCFTGGMVGIAARIFNRPSDLTVAEELTAGCVWAYDSNTNGIAPELFHVIPCPKQNDCKWRDDIWYDALAALHPYQPGVEESPSTRAERIKKLAAEMKLAPGFTGVADKRYILRPEAIESVFIMYRITGDQKWQDAAWRMFQAIEKVSRTDIAAAAISDITAAEDDVKSMQLDSMESFWLAETLKYFYLCFEDFGTVSLDDFVLNTEAHPLRRPGR